MSVTQFIALKEVKEKLKILRPKLSRKIGPPSSRPLTNHYALVGTAFDYLLRFEIKRRNREAISKQWVAELAVEKIWRRKVDGIEISRDVLKGVDASKYRDPRQIAQTGQMIIDETNSLLNTFYDDDSPSNSSYAKLAENAIMLAKLDQYFRSGKLDPDFDRFDPLDVDDIVSLLRLVPYEGLLSPETLLNPDFAESSVLIGGTDVDLITGDLMVDIKTTKKESMNAQDLDQLLAYLFIARNQQKIDPAFPEIKRLGLYFSRHGLLWEQPVSLWTEHSEFKNVEEWFIDAADQYYSRKVKLKYPDGEIKEVELRYFNP